MSSILYKDMESRLKSQKLVKLYTQRPTSKTLVGCWIFGETYDVKAFQDEIMLFLLQRLEKHRALDKPHVIRLTEPTVDAFKNTAKGSKIREFLVEEAVIKHHKTHEIFGMSMEYGDVLEFEGTRFFQPFTDKVETDDYPKTSRFDAENCEPNYFWKNYMIGPAEKYEAAQYQQSRKSDQ